MPNNDATHGSSLSRNPRDYEGLQSVDAYDPMTGLHTVQDDQPKYSYHQEQHPSRNDYAVQSSAIANSKYEQDGPHSTPTGDKRILGLRRTTFLLTVSNIVLAIGLVLAGVLLGLVGNKTAECSINNTSSSNNATIPKDSTSTLPPSSPSTPLPICFNTTAPPPLGAPLGNPIAECPLPLTSPSEKSNYYTVPSTNLTFSRLCSTDYPGNDMAHFPVTTMQDCLALCAQLHLYPSSIAGPCVSVTWVYDNGGDAQGEGISYCILKNGTGSSVRNQGMESAILVG